MGRGKRKKNYQGHFVQLHDYMTDSKAWKALSPKAVWVYIEMKKKYRGNNENNISLTYKEVEYKMSAATYSKAIKELENYGFINRVRPGGLYKKCTIYGLSSRWQEKNKEL